ncbi:hypothetical protein SAMN05421747_106191 [Parapedobacter composti]|uniref:Prepilin-type N-terminal cleavage/methylation domain-containing protein n=1 Tax=Parapedobacter composti TaxID=623281 RepID=A0A1I1HHW8_9SPHI|nr:prepilin-type N-terminal cleavage/methylation domain-containing protein [Parapedobacter composti]SFC23406.1 hypothetical protein SAMN05421747_106191 [Parapedobacter composti]
MVERLVGKRLKASTLVEVLVALVIITLVVAISATFYATMALKRPDNAVNMLLELRALAQESKRSGGSEQAQYELGNGIQVDKVVTPYHGDTLLAVLELRGQRTATGETAVYREIIIKSHENKQD